MFLSVDVGNTQTTLGLFDASGAVVRQWRMATDATDTADELHERLFGYFLMLGLGLADVTDVAIASVVPILSQEWQRMMADDLGVEPLMVSARRDCGIRIDMPNPNEVGADRIANALAAREAYGEPVIVVDFGTATNIDVVDATGAFRGGAIMPGLLLSANALFSRAAKLSSVQLVAPPEPLGDSTEHAVQSGVVLGAAALAEGLVRRIQNQLHAERPNAPAAKVVGTGGYARVIAGATDVFESSSPEPTVRGIYGSSQHRAAKRAARKARGRGGRESSPIGRSDACSLASTTSTPSPRLTVTRPQTSTATNVPVQMTEPAGVTARTGLPRSGSRSKYSSKTHARGPASERPCATSRAHASQRSTTCARIARASSSKPGAGLPSAMASAIAAGARGLTLPIGPSSSGISRFTPTPQTAYTPAAPVPASTKIPASFLAPTTTSLGHLSSALVAPSSHSAS